MATTYEVSRTIKAPPERVWALLTQPAAYATWNPAVLSLEGTMAVGERLRLVSIVNPKRAFTPRVAAMTAPNHMVWADGMPLGLFRGERTYTLEPVDGNATRFHMSEAFTGPLAGLISRTIPDMNESFALFADGLKLAAENGSMSDLKGA